MARFPRTIEHVDIGSRCINPARRINRPLSFAKERSLLNVPRVAPPRLPDKEREREISRGGWLDDLTGEVRENASSPRSTGHIVNWVASNRAQKNILRNRRGRYDRDINDR